VVFQRPAQIALALSFARDDLVATSFAMARVAEVRGSPAEEQCDRTAPFALVVDVFVAVLLAILDAFTDASTSASAADELVSFDVSRFLLVIVTVFQTAEVGVFALEAHVVGTLKHREAGQVSVVGVARIQKLGILVQSLDFGPF
jgi:hypothetical protein